MVESFSCSKRSLDGSACRGRPRPKSSYCFAHDPSLEDLRKVARERGGRNRRRPKSALAHSVSFNSVADVIELLRLTAADTVGLENSLGRSRTLAYIAQVALKAIGYRDLERQMLEIEGIMRPRLEFRKEARR